MLVSNTSTLVLLAKIGCLEAFLVMSPKIEIPVQVKQEALFKEDSYYAKKIKQLIDGKKITVHEANKNKISGITSQFNLDEGEAAAYALYDAKKHNAILTDDGELIKLCKLQKVPFICAMAAIIRMFEKKKLTREETMNKLRDLHEIGRYSLELYDYFRNEVK